jgi:prolipoprotein diacylglyceryl transferase
VLDLASIPSPGSNRLGPLHMYGLMIAIGVVAAVEVGRARWKARGGNPDDVYAIAFWAVPAGLIGARLYHVITDWDRLYSGGRWQDAFKIWEGGLGIPGGMAAGIATGVWVAHRRGWRLSVGLDALIPGIALAQAIGRIGNWWNQELFGRPTSLPWGIEIDAAHRPTEFIGSSTFQPTFLYEMLWNLALFGFLIWIDRKRTLRPGNVLPLYVGGYFLGRLWVEALRIDTASEILGLRVNIWMSILGIGAAVVALVARGLRRRPEDSEEPYRDGHRWTPPGSEQGPATDEADEVASDGHPDIAGGEDAASDPPVGGALRGTRRRASARSLSDEPEEAPPST